MSEEQDKIIELRGIQQRIERLIIQLSDQSLEHWQLSGRLRSLTGICENLLRVWKMSEEQVAEQHNINVYDNPKNKILGLIFHQLELVMANDLKKEKHYE